jgi:hypothetical protein
MVCPWPDDGQLDGSWASAWFRSHGRARGGGYEHMRNRRQTGWCCSSVAEDGFRGRKDEKAW